MKLSMCYYKRPGALGVTFLVLAQSTIVAAGEPVVGEFDGDGKPDIAYIVPPSGSASAAYAILLSSTNYNPLAPLFIPAGYPFFGDTPVVGDFDGDGKHDPGIWRA